MMPHATKKDYQDAFAGLKFPTSKSAIVNRAVDRGGIDSEVRAVLTQLPDRSYESLEELQGTVHTIYIASGAPPESIPL